MTELNEEGIPGPGGRPWGDTTIRGQVDRGTGLLNNTLYIGRMEWNRCSYVKNPQTGKKVARVNPIEAREIAEVPHLRIVDDALWARVKARQSVVRIEMGRDSDGNALNHAHRRQFLLSGCSSVPAAVAATRSPARTAMPVRCAAPRAHARMGWSSIASTSRTASSAVSRNA
jgi:hypothetical protein